MIKKVGNTVIHAKHRATYHCGSVELELYLPDGIVDPRRCNCSQCCTTMTNTLAHYPLLEESS